MMNVKPGAAAGSPLEGGGSHPVTSTRGAPAAAGVIQGLEMIYPMT